jgi:hypothetical protein
VSVTVIVPVVEAFPALVTARVNTLFVPAPKFPLCEVKIDRSGPCGVSMMVVESLVEAVAVVPPPDTLT